MITLNMVMNYECSMQSKISNTLYKNKLADKTFSSRSNYNGCARDIWFSYFTSLNIQKKKLTVVGLKSDLFTYRTMAVVLSSQRLTAISHRIQNEYR